MRFARRMIQLLLNKVPVASYMLLAVDQLFRLRQDKFGHGPSSSRAPMRYELRPDQAQTSLAQGRQKHLKTLCSQSGPLQLHLRGRAGCGGT